MRALAEFIMRGRVQAAVVALLGSWFPLISPAAVALVTLRHGQQLGSQVLVWALLPALAALMASQLGPLMAWVTIAGLLAVFFTAALLRSSVSWAYSLLGLVALSTLAALLLALLIPDPVQGLTAMLGEVLQQLQSQAAAAAGKADVAMLAPPGDAMVVGLVAYVIAINGLFSLLLARWWQAALYNPGGFQTEFHQLRLQAPQALVCGAATVYCWGLGGDYHIWGNLFALPLLVVAVAIVHRLVAARKAGGQWLILFYVAMIMFNPTMVLLVVIAFVDTWINFRARLASRDQ